MAIEDDESGERQRFRFLALPMLHDSVQVRFAVYNPKNNQWITVGRIHVGTYQWLILKRMLEIGMVPFRRHEFLFVDGQGRTPARVEKKKSKPLSPGQNIKAENKRIESEWSSFFRRQRDNDNE